MIGAFALAVIIVLVGSIGPIIAEFLEAREKQKFKEKMEAQQAEIARINKDIFSGEWDKRMKVMIEKALAKRP